MFSRARALTGSGARFGEGEIAPILIAVQSPDSIYAPERLAALNDFVARIRAD